MFLRFVEALVDSSPLALPPSKILLGTWCALLGLPQNLRFFKLPMAPIPAGPNCHLIQRYTITSTDGCSRRFVAYHSLLSSALQALRKPKIVCAFSVVFEGHPTVVNNVGVIVLEFDASVTVRELTKRFEANMRQALSSNALAVTGLGFVRYKDLNRP